MPSLKNKVVLITGGARGIGSATAQAIVAAGGKVVLTDVDQEPLDKLIAELGSNAALGIVADVTDLPRWSLPLRPESRSSAASTWLWPTPASPATARC